MKTVKFNEGKLKIMQISDLQDTKNTCVDALVFIDNALKKVKPDLVLLTGDQLDVLGLWGKGWKNEKNVRKAIKNLMSVFEKNQVPYALTFGNHDGETGIPVNKQVEYYREGEYCICFENTEDGRPDEATYNIPVMSSDSETVVMSFFMIDTHNVKLSDGYEGTTKEQLDWFLRTSEDLGDVPSMVFQHIPPDEIYELLKPVKKGTKGSQPAFGSRKGEYYSLNWDNIVHRGAYGETPSTLSKSNREFTVMKQQGNVFGIYFGHDHNNSFIGNVQGIDMGYCPGAGYNTYGMRHRGIRVFEFEESNVKKYNTYTLDYSQCCKDSEATPIKNMIMTHAPCCKGALPQYILRTLGLLTGIALVLWLLALYVNAELVIRFIFSLVGAGLIYGAISAVYNAVMRKKLTEVKKSEQR